MAREPFTINAAAEMRRHDAGAFAALPSDVRELAEAAFWQFVATPGNRIGDEVEMRIDVLPNEAARELERRCAERRAAWASG